MSDDDNILPDEWAEEGVRRINHAVEVWNVHFPEEEPVRVVWGYRDKDDADRERNHPSGIRGQSGLLCHDGLDVELWFSKGDDPDHPILCLIEHFFLSGPLGVHTRRRMLHVIEHAAPGVHVSFSREGKTIFTYGVATWVPLESLNGQLLRDAVLRVINSAVEVVNYLDPSEEENQ